MNFHLFFVACICYVMAIMYAADLFTGIGGFALALRPFGVRTALFCDCDPASQRVLRSRIAGGSLDDAPIHDDVASLHLAPGTVDIICAGFPCTGFSCMGKQEGRMNAGSALVSHVFRLVEQSRPPLVFLENVSRIVNFPEHDEIAREFARLGYEMRWGIFKASWLGAPHTRPRWFALLVRTDLPGLSLDVSLDQQHDEVPLYDWRQEPMRMLPTPTCPRLRERNRLLGNTLVPVVARVAFLWLFTGCQHNITDLLKERRWTCVPSIDVTTRRRKDRSSGLMAGCYVNGCYYTLPRPSFRVSLQIERRFVLRPDAFVSPKPRKRTQHQCELVRTPIELQRWTTPRTLNQSANFLTERSWRDLATQLRFEERTENRHTNPDPRYVEWMQGYPLGWTE